ncbi:hypothetical protein [Pseudarthrobacter sp. MM222]|uniref:hypothetical protein n=1 Tax=Pseudarthrobacter sp. MM222 TaxID=3018929 RepID=UPI00221ECFC1|nr:hypothetical protein [Pseudarthrobacter sp. MM222]
MPPIPDAHLAAFNRLMLRARQLFGAAVTEELIAPDTYRLPSFRVGDLSVIGEQWLVVAISPGPYPHVYPWRWEFDWDSDVDEAIALLERYQERFLLAPSVGDVFAARLIALVGSDGEIDVATEQPEFDLSLTVRPRRSGSIPLKVHIISGHLIVVESHHLGWWTFGGDFWSDGSAEAWKVIEQLVVRGGIVRSRRRSSQLLTPDGDVVSGPHRDGVRTRRAQDLYYPPYR